MKKPKNVIVICLCLILTLLSACSYREFEDSLRRQLDGEDENDYINETTVPEPSEDEIDSESIIEDEVDNEKNESEVDKLYYIGDTIRQYDVEYTLNDIEISDNINEVSLDKESFGRRHALEDNGDIKDGYKLVTLDVTIKNISAEGYDPDGEHNKPNLFIENRLGFKDDLEDPQGPFTIELSYFSEHPPYEQNQWNDYLQFQVDHGEEIEATVGWFVPVKQLNTEPLYYIIGHAHGPSGAHRIWEYFYIVSEGEIVYPE